MSPWAKRHASFIAHDLRETLFVLLTHCTATDSDCALSKATVPRTQLDGAYKPNKTTVPLGGPLRAEARLVVGGHELHAGHVSVVDGRRSRGGERSARERMRHRLATAQRRRVTVKRLKRDHRY